VSVFSRILRERKRGVSVGKDHTVGTARCHVASDGQVRCDFGRANPGSNPDGLPEGCCVDADTHRWICPGLPSHGRPADVRRSYVDETGQAWALIGAKHVTVPVCVGARADTIPGTARIQIPPPPPKTPDPWLRTPTAGPSGWVTTPPASAPDRGPWLRTPPSTPDRGPWLRTPPPSSPPLAKMPIQPWFKATPPGTTPDIPPSQIPTAPKIPSAQIPIPTPGQIPVPTPTPGQIPVPTPTPGQIPVPTPTPGQIPVPTPTPGQIPIPTPGWIPTPGRTPVPSWIPTPGQIPAPGYPPTLGCVDPRIGPLGPCMVYPPTPGPYCPPLPVSSTGCIIPPQYPIVLPEWPEQDGDGPLGTVAVGKQACFNEELAWHMSRPRFGRTRAERRVASRMMQRGYKTCPDGTTIDASLRCAPDHCPGPVQNPVVAARPGTPLMRQANPVSVGAMLSALAGQTPAPTSPRSYDGICFHWDMMSGCYNVMGPRGARCICPSHTGTVTSKSPCGQGSYACGTNPDGSVMCCDGRSGRQVMPMTPRMARRARSRATWRNPGIARGACPPGQEICGIQDTGMSTEPICCPEWPQQRLVMTMPTKGK
jgi:hypothetical protein